ncbi:MAG: DEAD/DEAH box helicase [Cyanobacteriota bacterium]
MFEFNFELDDFQKEAIEHIKSKKSVVVCAPTGSGKTVIAEYAINIAIENNKRVFYTTPLKALSNQKFRDFQKILGEENVGLLTGDISINRDASVVVMTTEVFRNMLYGTNLGRVEDTLKNISFVVLDECHYMNDEERGTVWEESIIYCPKDIQILALSATIANHDELTGWINSVHNNTELVYSDFRPVPLRHFYYSERQLFPLISPGGKLNQRIRRIKLNKGTRAKARKQSPAPMLSLLHIKDMLPAIYFCFSRKKCDTYLAECSKITLLNEFEERRLAQIINEYIDEYPMLANHKHLEYIYSGVASHHAGLLPNWKVLIEKLFQQGLIKVVFATETLAAGINMPARTTIISEISKRTDEGHRNFTASEFLQMSGRAGRRGMDKVGYVVTLSSPFHEPKEIADLALSTSDPLASQFTPTYSMVLNLLQRFTLQQAKELILSSFGYYTSSQRLSPLYSARSDISGKMKSVSIGKCPYNLTDDDLIRYQKNKEIYVEIKRLYNILRKQAKKASRSAADEVEDYRLRAYQALSEIERVQCHKCDLYRKHIKSLTVLRRFNKRLEQLDKVIEIEKDLYWNQFVNLVKVLTEYEYLKNNKPTELGIVASNFKAENELYLLEVINSGLMDSLNYAEVAAVFCALISEEPRTDTHIKIYPSRKAREALKEIYYVMRKVNKVQRSHKVYINTLLNEHLSGVVQDWAMGSEWEQIVSQTAMDEGDIVRTMKRTVDILRQVTHAPYLNRELVSKCSEALNAINREPVLEIF